MPRRRNLFNMLLVSTLLLVGASSVAAQGFSSFLELRVYPVSNQERFLEYFEEHYLESQEVVGMRIWGQFRDLDEPRHFVWLRGYRSMEERLSGLKQFYTSPLWAETGPEAVSMLTARATHVHFLEPLTARDAFVTDWGRPPLLSEAPQDEPRGVLIAQVYSVGGDPTLVGERVRSTVVPRVEAAGGIALGLFKTSQETNNFPILPFLEDENVVVLFSSFGSRQQFAAIEKAIEAPAELEVFVLEPGRRSRLRHRAGP